MIKSDEDLILERREEHWQLIKHLNKKTIITIKANIPGKNKRISEAYLLVELFKKELNNELEEPNEELSINDEDGPMVIMGYDKEIKDIKELLIQKETNHPLGRFIDLDVFINGETSIHRKRLRKCYLCDKEAFICQRLKSHSLNELLTYLRNQVQRYLEVSINNLIIKSMTIELELDPKFGLVTPLTSGSHQDMQYEVMKASFKPVSEGLCKMFKVGFTTNDLDEIFKEIRKIGLETEVKMFEVTNKINTYKGLIFGLGLICASLGYYLNHQIDNNDLFINISYMTKDLDKEFYQKKTTNGIKAYQENKLKGARGEAMRGYPLVKKYYPLLNEPFNKEKLILLLINLICETDDTVFYKRAGNIAKYDEFKQKFSEINEYNKEEINNLSKLCIKNNLSFGGSADQLIMIIFLALCKEKGLIK